MPFSWVYIAFGIFILACGLTHFLYVATVWHPIYWADAGVRIVTAIASIGTAFLLFPLVPKVVAISNLSQLAKERGEKLETTVQELSAANDKLLREEEERARLAAENAALAERAKIQEFQERFLAILGHDLRNPLAAIEMGATILRDTANGEKRARILDRIDSSTVRMSRMIEQILDLTRSRLSGGLEVKPTAGDICEPLNQVVEELRVAHSSRSIDLQCERPCPGLWDRDRLEQVFSNLVSNAIHHGDAKSPVTVTARVEGTAVVVTVHNEGPPIPEELRARLFDPFRRGERDSRAQKTAGLGLGLYISREIVLAHGGTLEAHSTSSKGTTFIAKFPRTPPRLGESTE